MVVKKDSFFSKPYVLLSLFLLILCVLSLWFVFSQISNLNVKMEKNDNYESNPTVVFDTNFGIIKLEVFLNESPVTAGNFINLVKTGFYDGVKFHRVINGFMIQSGDPLSKNDSLKSRWGTGGSENIEDEFISGLSNVRGTIAMANTGKKNSGSSQFFINLVNNTGLDWDKEPLTSKHPVFGKVIEGMDVVDKIALVSTGSGNMPLNPVIIQKAYID